MYVGTGATLNHHTLDFLRHETPFGSSLVYCKSSSINDGGLSIPKNIKHQLVIFENDSKFHEYLNKNARESNNVLFIPNGSSIERFIEKIQSNDKLIKEDGGIIYTPLHHVWLDKNTF